MSIGLEETVTVYVMYCSNRRTHVRVTFPGTGGQPAGPPPGSGVLCLDAVSEACSGATCPIFRVPVERMLVRLEIFRGEFRKG